ncbi:(R,R)-butanediol dehydrogenase [Leucoagaricus sp. SymC.cos]|nr:(R,R)-butanediol dehydrogenase [Leucoagaricus sp. SymC.cos]
MKAARFYGVGDVRVEDIPEPVPKEGQVKVKIAWNGICGSDLHAYLTTVPIYATEVPNVVTGETVPVTLGHEFSGSIVELGPGVDSNKWTPGQNVVIEPIISCRRPDCFPCAEGTHNVCPHVSFIGCSGWGGGLAEYIAVDVLYVHLLPQGIPLEIGACVEPLSIAYHSVKRSNFKPGQSVLIAGAGPIGLFLLKVVRSLDPTATILVSEPASIRRQFALEHGATHVFDPLKEQIPQAVRQIVPAGVHVAFDAAGVQATLDSCLFSLRPRGTYLNVAIWETNATVNVNLILSRELNVTGIVGYDHIHEEVIKLLAEGKFPNIEKLITRKIKLDDVVEDGLKRLIREKDQQVKILVSPTGV